MTFFSHQRVSQIILGVVVSIIVLTFIFSGIDNMKGWSLNSSQVASVDGSSIEYRDFQTKLAQQVQMYSQMMGGKTLSQKELEQFGIKQRVLQGMIQQKLLQNLGETLNLNPSATQLTEEIKKLPYFVTNKQFDVEKYKMILANNGYTPQSFEDIFRRDLLTRKVEESLGNVQVSKNFGYAVSQFKSKKLTATAFRIQKNKLQKQITITPEQVKTFLADASSKIKIESHFARRKPELDRPEQVEARHILFKVEDPAKEQEVEKRASELKAKLTVANFSEYADKVTEDPSGKGQGGKLGKFSRGRMVPEFEDAIFKMKPGTIEGPIKTQFGYHIILLDSKTPEVNAKLADFTDMMAREILQEDNQDALKSLVAKTKTELEAVVATGNQKQLEELQKKYEAQMSFEQPLNLWDGKIATITLEDDQLEKIFSQTPTSPLAYGFENASSLLVVGVKIPAAVAGAKTEDPAVQADREKMTLQFQIARQIREKALGRLTEQAKIFQNPDLMN